MLSLTPLHLPRLNNARVIIRLQRNASPGYIFPQWNDVRNVSRYISVEKQGRQYNLSRAGTRVPTPFQYSPHLSTVPLPFSPSRFLRIPRFTVSIRACQRKTLLGIGTMQNNSQIHPPLPTRRSVGHLLALEATSTLFRLLPLRLDLLSPIQIPKLFLAGYNVTIPIHLAT